MALSKEQEMTVPKEVRSIRPDTTVDWNPQVLEDWMADQGEVSLSWISEKIGKNKFYLYTCKNRGRIGRDALVKLQDLTGIPKSFFMGNSMPEKEETVEEKQQAPNAHYWDITQEEHVKKEATGQEKETVEEKKETPVRVYTAPVAEFQERGVMNPIYVPEDVQIKQKIRADVIPGPKIPKGWISLSSPEANYFVRADDIVHVRQLLNGTMVLTNHGSFSVIENGLTIMERIKNAE